MYNIPSSEIRVRDPYIVPVRETGKYYLFGTTDTDPWNEGEGFLVYESEDLEHWSEPKWAFLPPEGFWANQNFWAPEVHHFNGYWYIFASFKAEGVCRGTQILRSESVTGPYAPISDGPVTPRDWECLDGTLHIDPAGKPHIVFCHEWLQIKDGTVCTMALSDDLSAAISEPRTLWKATDYPFVRPVGKNKDSYVTDGPFLYRTRQGNLLCIWSTFESEGYAELICHSDNGELSGNWQVSAEPLFRQNGGHGMIFRGSDGVLRFVMHRPNSPATMERPVILALKDANGSLTLE